MYNNNNNNLFNVHYMPSTIVLYMDYRVFLYYFTSEEAEVQSKFWYICRMKYHKAITTSFRDTEKYHFIQDFFLKF